VTDRTRMVSRSGPKAVPSHSDLLGGFLLMTLSRRLLSLVAFPRRPRPVSEIAGIAGPSALDTRDAGPRPGSPLWAYLTAVSFAGLLALAIAQVRPGLDGLPEAARTPLLWMVLVLILLGELRPVMVNSSASLVGGT